MNRTKTLINLRLFHKKLLRHRKKRKEVKKNERRRYNKQQNVIRKIYPKEKRIGYGPIRSKIKFENTIPTFYSERIKLFRKNKNSFADCKLVNESNVFHVPSVFSFSDNYQESCKFLRKLFNALYSQSHEKIIINYKECTQIDVAASICMDIILADFINYYNQCIKSRQKVKVAEIRPINYDKPAIKKVLFSIGAFRNIKGVKIDFDDIITYPLRIGDKNKKDYSKKREVDITEMVDYIIACLNKMGRNLTPDAEKNLYKVIGEVIINAEEHSNTSRRFAIGYFEERNEENKHYGIFNLAILNFGNTIYDTFTSPDCKNLEVVEQMKDLSAKYTKNRLFKKAEFEEETLWTLYALQEGVTRKADWKRGNGSIRFIDSFFKLKGDTNCDNISKMIITSGNTRIIFNGEYSIVEKERGPNKEKYKMMTFNKAGDIEEKPDNKFVTFANNYFPGTLITAKIFIDEYNTEIA